jgi:hypothetical protein
MAVSTGIVSLGAVGTDLGLGTGVNLSLNHVRARVAGKKTGIIQMSQLRGTATSMCVDHYPSWNINPTNVIQGFKEYTNGKDYSITSPSNDTTKDVRIGVTGYISETDATCELMQGGYCDRGSYNLTGHFKSDFSSSSGGSPFSVSVVCNATSWLRGSQTLVFNQTESDRNGLLINQSFNIPDGYPYLTLVVYQFVYLHPNHPYRANYNTPYKTDFTDVRVRKIS